MKVETNKRFVFTLYNGMGIVKARIAADNLTQAETFIRNKFPNVVVLNVCEFQG